MKDSYRSGPGSHPGSMWGLWWIKRQWGRFSPSTSVSPANHHSANFSIIVVVIITTTTTTTRGRYNRPIGGRSGEWTQLDSNPHYTKLKKNLPSSGL
jgi:hypothetical protein